MSERYQIEIPPEAGPLVKRLRDRAGLGAALARTMDLQNQLTVGRIQRAYMSFPRQEPATPLGTRVQSNRLRGSVWAPKTVVTAGGLESSIGSSVVYAAIQEFGFTGTETVFSHNRTIKAHGRGKKRKGAVTFAVKTYTRHVNLPARRMFQKGIEDRISEYGTALLGTMLKFEGGSATGQ